MARLPADIDPTRRAIYGRSVYGSRHEFKAGALSDFCRVTFQCELSQVFHFSTGDVDISGPLPSLLVEIDAPMTRAATKPGDVLGIQPLGKRSQILATVVQAIPVLVISLKIIVVFKAEQGAMKSYFATASTDALTADRIAIRPQRPAPLRRPFRVGRVDDRVSCHTTTSVQGHQRRAITVDDDRCPFVAAFSRTVRSVAWRRLDFRWRTVDISAALDTLDEVSCTMSGHRAYSPVSSPGLLEQVRGRFNFTMRRHNAAI